ncbi:ribonuclease T2 [Paracoccaceae bacterium Fryx2]|nr:ribonuclease T2 [Paracoccaceae bacterium Fryx2]
MRLGVVALLGLLMAGPVRAEGEAAGDFDYYVLALSWSATWCALEGDARGDAQCARGRGLTFTLHGLWPQHEAGWPSYCRTGVRDPSRAETAAMADVMGGAGLAWHQWKKHGRCSGLTAQGYFAVMRRALAGVRIPAVFAGVDRDLRLPAAVVEEAFVEANPGLSGDMVTVTCTRGRVQEVRICLDRDLAPRRCGADVRRDCALADALLGAVR